MLTLTYKPIKVNQLIGNNTSKQKIIEWAKEWKPGDKPLMIYGPAGVGKTSSAYALANDMGWTTVELNAGNKRDKNNIESVIGENSTMSLFGGYRLIIIDDVDQMSGKEDRGAMTAINNIIKESKNPIILTALDYWNQRISTLRKSVTPVEYKKINSGTLGKYLISIAEKENIQINDQIIEQITENVNGDVRAALNDLETLNPNIRDTQINIFEVMKNIFKKTDYNEIRQTVFNSSVDYDMLLLWILENIPYEYEGEDISNAFYYLSRADVFRGRIYRQQYWGYLRYVSDLMACGVGLSKKQKYYKFVRYKFPSYLSLMSKTKSSRTKIKSIANKVREHTHDSINDVQKYLWLLSLMANNEMDLSKYDFDKKEIDFLKQYKR